MITADELSKKYHNWLEEEIMFMTLENDTIRIDTSFYDRHNDSIILYVVPESQNNLTITDGGYLVDDLNTEGISITNSKKRRNIFFNQLTSNGVQYNEDNNFLIVDSSIENFAKDKHRLLQAILSISSLLLNGGIE